MMINFNFITLVIAILVRFVMFRKLVHNTALYLACMPWNIRSAWVFPHQELWKCHDLQSISCEFHCQRQHTTQWLTAFWRCFCMEKNISAYLLCAEKSWYNQLGQHASLTWSKIITSTWDMSVICAATSSMHFTKSVLLPKWSCPILESAGGNFIKQNSSKLLSLHLNCLVLIKQEQLVFLMVDITDLFLSIIL